MLLRSSGPKLSHARAPVDVSNDATASNLCPPPYRAPQASPADDPKTFKCNITIVELPLHARRLTSWLELESSAPRVSRTSRMSRCSRSSS